jgi:hypothetical protein
MTTAETIKPDWAYPGDVAHYITSMGNYRQVLVRLTAREAGAHIFDGIDLGYDQGRREAWGRMDQLIALKPALPDGFHNPDGIDPATSEGGTLLQVACRHNDNGCCWECAKERPEILVLRRENGDMAEAVWVGDNGIRGLLERRLGVQEQDYHDGEFGGYSDEATEAYEAQCRRIVEEAVGAERVSMLLARYGG